MTRSHSRSNPPPILTAVARMPFAQRRRALIELCARGLLTCTRGRPGDEDATYALGWVPLDAPERYPAEIQRRHEENMRRLVGENSHA